MRLKEDIKPLTYLESRAGDVLRQVSESRRPLVITEEGEAKAVILDVDSYQALRDAVLMLQFIAQGEEDVRAGRLIPQEEVFARIASRLPEE
ncbi:MAG TPA: type II toxin-antitoxin system Phd/YefM family antitoxin [Thermoanaerobaculia bacterium]|nr:type II toxin-antitoxin system Phd/YefM family antitoxin [Thermoanaerobaculia bacterium]